VVIRVPRDLRSSDAELGVEVSSDLRTWSPATRLRQEPLGESLARETWGRIPPGPGVPVFLRLTARPIRP
jgi:hypothetical protein